MLIQFLHQPIMCFCEPITEQHSPLQASFEQTLEWNYHRNAASIDEALMSP